MITEQTRRERESDLRNDQVIQTKCEKASELSVSTAEPLMFNQINGQPITRNCHQCQVHVECCCVCGQEGFQSVSARVRVRENEERAQEREKKEGLPIRIWWSVALTPGSSTSKVLRS
jgi:hypothetical protein